jgi:hypothetical protein
VFDGGPNSWVFRFEASKGQELIPGTYKRASRFAGTGSGAIDIGGEGRGCNKTYGQFTVLEAEFGDNNEVVRFAADFEQHCEGWDVPSLHGSVRFHSSLPPPTRRPANAPTPTPAGRPCWGDCSGDGAVTVDELIVGVNLALGTQSVDTCRLAYSVNDSRVSIDELIRAIDVSLAGCNPEL